MTGVRNRMKWLVVVAVLAGACSRKIDPLDLFGNTIAPPAPFDTLKLGMSEQEAKAALPDLETVRSAEGFAQLAVAKVPVKVEIEHGRLTEIRLELDRPSFEAELAKRWGPARPLEHGNVEWQGPIWRATHSCTHDGKACAVSFQRPRRPLTPAFFPDRPAPPAALANLRVGMSYDEARKHAPDLVGPIATTGKDLGVDDVSASVLADPGSGLLMIGIDVWTDEAYAMLVKQWGEPEPTAQRYAREPRTCWQGDPWRACFERAVDHHRAIRFERVVPLATVLGEGPEVAYVAGSIGALRADIEKKRGKLEQPGDMPDSELGPMSIELTVDDAGKVTGYDLYIGYSGEADRTKVFEMLKAKWQATGKEPPLVGEQPTLVLRAKAPRVTLTDVKGVHFRWRVSVTP